MTRHILTARGTSYEFSKIERAFADPDEKDRARNYPPAIYSSVKRGFDDTHRLVTLASVPFKSISATAASTAGRISVSLSSNTFIFAHFHSQNSKQWLAKRFERQPVSFSWNRSPSKTGFRYMSWYGDSLKFLTTKRKNRSKSKDATFYSFGVKDKLPASYQAFYFDGHKFFA